MSNLIKVYSPDGEVFENSPANARDLVVHAGWSYHPPTNKSKETTVVEKLEEKSQEEDIKDEAESEASNGEEEQSEEIIEEQEVAPLRGRRKKVQ